MSMPDIPFELAEAPELARAGVEVVLSALAHPASATAAAAIGAANLSLPNLRMCRLL
jgi:hypothetical protein